MCATQGSRASVLQAGVRERRSISLLNHPVNSANAPRQAGGAEFETRFLRKTELKIEELSKSIANHIIIIAVTKVLITDI